MNVVVIDTKAELIPLRRLSASLNLSLKKREETGKIKIKSQIIFIIFSSAEKYFYLIKISPKACSVGGSR
jgi:hypothetical protein